MTLNRHGVRGLVRCLQGGPSLFGAPMLRWDPWADEWISFAPRCGTQRRSRGCCSIQTPTVVAQGPGQVKTHKIHRHPEEALVEELAPWQIFRLMIWSKVLKISISISIAKAVSFFCSHDCGFLVMEGMIAYRLCIYCCEKLWVLSWVCLQNLCNKTMQTLDNRRGNENVCSVFGNAQIQSRKYLHS